MRTIIVVDTNVLLADPKAVLTYENTDVVIPQVVLSELDKIKSARSDKEIKYQGREVSRLLFELSEFGPLTEGVELDNNSVVRVWSAEPDGDLPGALNLKNADDRILACALQLARDRPDAEVVLLTNDLNMLLKAQTLGIRIRRHEGQERSALSRFFSRLIAKRIAWLWLALPLTAAMIFIGLWVFRVPSPIETGVSPITQELEFFAGRELQLVNLLRKEPKNADSWMKLGDIYTAWGNRLKSDGNDGGAKSKYLAAVDSYLHVLKLSPDNLFARTNLGSAYFYLGNADQAISQFVQVLSQNPDHAVAHFNLGVILWEHARDPKAAAKEFEAYLRLAPDGDRAQFARQAIGQIRAAEKIGL